MIDRDNYDDGGYHVTTMGLAVVGARTGPIIGLTFFGVDWHLVSVVGVACRWRPFLLYLGLG